MFTGFRRNITRLFSSKYLYYTNAAIGSSFLVCGYTVAEKLRSHINNNHDNLTASKLKMLSVLGAFSGTYQTFAYHYIDRIKFKRAIVVKLILDQLVLAPISISIFLFANETCDNKWNWKAGYDYTISTFWSIFLADMTFWLPVQFINFQFVHPRFRYAYVACTSIVWNIILSFLHLEFQNQQKKAKKTEELLL